MNFKAEPTYSTHANTVITDQNPDQQSTEQSIPVSQKVIGTEVGNGQHYYPRDEQDFTLPNWLVILAISINPRLDRDEITRIQREIRNSKGFNLSARYMTRLIYRLRRLASKKLTDEQVLESKSTPPQTRYTGSNELLRIMAIKRASITKEAMEGELQNDFMNGDIVDLILEDILGDEKMVRLIQDIGDILSQEAFQSTHHTIKLDLARGRDAISRFLKDNPEIYNKQKIKDQLEKLSIYILVNYGAGMEMSRRFKNKPYSSKYIIDQKDQKYKLSHLEYALCKRLYLILSEILEMLKETDTTNK